MKLITLSFMTQAITVLGSIYDTILPTISPTITQDPWPCTTEVLEKYFDPPKPTGELLTALLHHGDELLKGCTPVGTNAQGVPTCTFPAQSQWCAITIPTTLSSTYSAYGSTASSWWSRYRSEAVDFATYCPGRWYKAMNAMPGGGAWLNDTIAFAGCYEADHPITAATTTTTTTIIIPTPTAVSSSAAASTTSSSSATSTRLPNGITTPEPTQPNIVSDCDNFHLVKGDDTCKGIAQTSGISLDDFLKWNPRVGGDCAGLKVAAYACVGTATTFNFDHGDLSEWKLYDGPFRSQSGSLYAGSSIGGKALLATPFIDFILEADVTIPRDANGNAGLVFRVSKPAVGIDSYRGYYAGINSDGSVALGRANNNWTHLGAHQLDFRPDQVYHMKIRATGSSIEVYVDDMENPKISVSDGVYRRGQVGVRVVGTAATYDNIRVARI